MGDFVIDMNEGIVASKHTGGEEFRFETILPYRTRPCVLRYVRIYEFAVALDKDVADIINDALALGRRDEVCPIIREFGIVGEWRPSSILIDRVQQVSTDRILAQRVPAHALWNTNFDHATGVGDVFAVTVRNDSPRVRVVRPLLYFYEESLGDWDTQNEVRALRNAVADQQLAIAELQVAVRRQAGTVASNSNPYDLGSLRSGWNNGDDY